MKRNALFCALVACSGGGGTSTMTGGTLGSTHDTSGIKSTQGPSGKADPKLAFRMQYANPGGMWMPQQMTLPGHADTFAKLGAQIDPKLLADPLAAPLGAVVSLGGCSASFVSPEALIVTNHHCVQGALKINSTKEDNLVEQGFLAATRAEERSAGPAARVYVAQAFKDVTNVMRDGLETIKDPTARDQETEKRSKQLIAACEKDRPGLRCNVSAFFRAGMYLQIEYLEIRDVRLVYVPHRSIGNYGGELDNWAWPRHTGDFSYLRAYVGKDGKPASYSTDNIPYKPKHHLKVSTSGVKAGDFVMIAGYPAVTSRTKTASEVRDYVESYLPYVIAYYRERYKMAEVLAAGSGDTAIKAGVEKQSIQNGLELLEGQLAGLTKGDLLVRKHALDQQVKAWAARPENRAYQAAIEGLEAIIADEQRTARVDHHRGVAFGGSRLLATALSLTRWAEERTKQDPDRKPGFQERDMVNATSSQKQFAKDFDRTFDRAAFRLALVHALKLPEVDRPWLARLLNAKRNQKIDEALIDRTLEDWYGAQQLEGEKLRLELLAKGTTARLEASKDPFIKAAMRIWPTVKVEEKRTDTRAGESVLLAPRYVEAMREVLGGLLAPDANGTVRITYGTVRSFKPGSGDDADRPLTVASEIPLKNTGAKDFDIAKQVIDAIRAKQYGPYGDAALGGELPVDFIADTDTTGGNSGSPVLDRNGELVGLNFDSSKTGVASRIVFNGATTRSIIVDARYMLWIMDRIDGADHLLREMGVEPKL